MSLGRVTASVSLAAILGAAAWVGPFLLRADLFDGDAAHHVFWLYRYADPALFPGDVTVDYLRTSAPAGYRALYAALVPFLDAMFASKLVSFLLFAGSVGLAAAIGAAIPSRDPALRAMLTALGLVLMLAVSTQTESLAPMGMQRAFGLPVTLLALWGLVARRYRLVGLSWIAAALTYPVVLPVIGLTAGVVFAADLVRERRLPPHWLFNAAAGIAAVVMVLLGLPDAPALGPAATYPEAMAMPEFGPGGRLDLWGPPSGAVFWHGMTGLGWSPKVLVAWCGLGLGAVLLRRFAPLPFAAWALAGVGLLLWLALRVFPETLMFGLYLPNRHPRWAIVAFGALAFSAVVQGLLTAWSSRGQATSAGVTRATGVALPFLVVLLLAPRAVQQYRQPVDADLQRTYAFLRTLPADTLVASHPDAADYVPLFTRRSVLASTETSMPWMTGYFAIVKPRVRDSLRAAYATSVDELDRILVPHGVRYFVVAPAAGSRRGYLQPWDAEVRQWQARADAAGRPLAHPPQERVVFRSGAYQVLRVGEWR
jgi:hypothetical protein